MKHLDRPLPNLGGLVLAGSILLLFALGALGDRPPDTVAPEVANERELTGRDIYTRVLENRFQSFRQTARLTSGDRAGNEQVTVFEMWFEDKLENSTADDEVTSRTLVRYLEPFELRHTGYLILNRRKETSDQFVYLASERRIRRVNLRGEPVFGSDFSFEDVLPREADDFSYTRLVDEAIDGVPVFVVEAVPHEKKQSEYSKLRIYIEKERSLPLRTRYWNKREIEIKTLGVDRPTIEKIDDVWIPKQMTMRSLRRGTYTRMTVEEVEPNVQLENNTFEMRRLIGH